MSILKKFHLTILTLILLVITFGTVTFAWISLSTVNNIEGLSLSATTGEELQISLDGINYSNNLTTEQLQSLFENISLNEVTSTNGIDFEAGGLRARNDLNEERDYLQFDIYFRTTENTHQVYLVNNVSNIATFDTSHQGTYVVSRGVTWRSNETFINSDTGLVVHEGDEDTYYASNAVRLSFVELKNELNDLDLRNENDLISWIYDPSEDATRGYGMTYGAYSYFTERTRYFIYIPSEKPEVKYQLTQINPRNPYEALSQDSLVTNLQDTGFKTQEGLSIYEGKLRITLWIEGWDADAFDAIDGDRLKIQLQFKLLKQAEVAMG